MTRKYPERVTASMIRVIHVNEVLLIRHSTEIQFGDSKELLGMVVMTNPGSFEFNRNSGWNAFKNGKDPEDEFKAASTPDLTMRNIIKAIRSGYEGRPEPSGIMRVYNLSNVRQPNGGKAEEYHELAKKVLPNERLYLLEDPITHSREAFLDECNRSSFVIMGFVDRVFDKKMEQVIDWSENIKHRRVCAVDNKGRLSHPRRWITEPYLMNKAIASLQAVLRD
ncbi:hypothetical protein [Paenibacillus sp. Marseille-Q9583]